MAQQARRRARLPESEFLTARIAAGTARALDPDIAARAVMGMFFGLMLFEIAGQPILTRDPDHVADELVDLLFDGLGPPRNREARR